MAEKDGKTEKPTDKRLKEGRKQGQIAKSPELAQWGTLYIGLTMVKREAGKASKFLVDEMNQAQQLMAAPDPNTALKFLADSIEKALMIVLPLTLTFMVLGIVAHVAQTRFNISFHALKPSIGKLNPIKGVKKLFSPQGFFNAGKQVIKTIILSFLVYKTLYTTMVGLTMNGPYPVGEIMSIVGSHVISFVKDVCLIGIAIGVADYMYSRKKTADGLKMSKHEIKEEARSSDLPPEVKGQIRRKQRQMSRNRMMAAIKTADVVITNPVHIAIALKYDADNGAPVVLAKGAGFIAEKIREKAEEEHIPLVQDIPLARALHKACNVGDEIPGVLFSAVARVLAFVFAMKKRGTSEGYHKMPGSPDLKDVEPWEGSNIEDSEPELIGV